MYLPPHFAAKDEAVALDVMREHPFASLVSVDDDGLPFVTHLPLHVEREEGGALVIRGHCARPNPHWRYLQARPKALVTFLGPHAYLSPKVYGDAERVPTWNYLAVHCQVQARLVEDEDEKDRLLKKLIGDHEPPFAQRWKGFDPEFARKMLAGIVGFELRVTDLQCKVKLNQHRPEAYAPQLAGYAQGGENERALARWMERFGWTGR
ncbi:MAG TPA: FMN-binding negative transcriptional regulator [Acetobacteraceae bacterium]|nr:FMN-binding negative transcriptional regulator [Acetobacteraceae bacterium]